MDLESRITRRDRERERAVHACIIPGLVALHSGLPSCQVHTSARLQRPQYSGAKPTSDSRTATSLGSAASALLIMDGLWVLAGILGVLHVLVSRHSHLQSPQCSLCSSSLHTGTA